MSAVSQNDVRTASGLSRLESENPRVTGYMRANKRWGRGRLRQQLALGLVCFWFGHKWSIGWEDEGVVHRRCEHGCGTIKVTGVKRDLWFTVG